TIVCSELYKNSIENFYSNNSISHEMLTTAICGINGEPENNNDILEAAKLISAIIPSRYRKNHIFIDISGIHSDTKNSKFYTSSINTINSIVRACKDYVRVEPIYTVQEDKFEFRFARRMMFQEMSSPTEFIRDEYVEFQPGDVYIGLETNPASLLANEFNLENLRAYNVEIYHVIPSAINMDMENISIDDLSIWAKSAISSDG
ncbi:hypothetical protein, partial [Chromobacterium sp. ASV23]|uniref:hypothetical protein n=1 Tax=Chromobacterium sp. ASV23 TaxID=2795110 RepID=UPI0018ED85E1